MNISQWVLSEKSSVTFAPLDYLVLDRHLTQKMIVRVNPELLNQGIYGIGSLTVRLDRGDHTELSGRN
jgi:hypothetical protein